MEQQNSLINHIIRSLMGAWQLIKLNPRAMDYFDQSTDGFWKSFWAIALVAPLFLLSMSINFDMAVEQGHQVSQTAHILNFLLQLPLVAIVLVFFTKFLAIDTHYARMIIAYNWLWVVMNYIILPLSILIAKDIISQKVGVLLVGVVALYLQLYVAWFMFRLSLKISTWLAIGVTAFESLFSLSVMQIIIRIF